MITNDDFDKFNNTGFYQNENGIRWTNGNVSIGFMGNFIVKDSLSMELTTYMPPICKDVNPKIVIIDLDNKEYQPVAFHREGDSFHYKFYFEQSFAIQKIRIVSETIKTAPPDQRVLSFPFISLEMKNKNR